MVFSLANSPTRNIAASSITIMFPPSHSNGANDYSITRLYPFASCGSGWKGLRLKAVKLPDLAALRSCCLRYESAGLPASM